MEHNNHSILYSIIFALLDTDILEPQLDVFETLKQGGFIMGKKIFSVMVTLLLVFSMSFTVLGKSVENEEGPDIHYNSIIVDTHVDTMMHVIDSTTWLPKVDIGEETPFEFDILKGQEGGLNAPFLAAYTSGYYDNNPRSISRTLALINALYWTEKMNPDHLNIATSVEEIRQITDEDKIAAIPSIEGGYSLEEHNAIELLHQYDDLGIQALGFTWNYSNALGEGANEVYGDPDRTPSEGGLTELGEEVAIEMNKLGMAIDISHMARSTFWDVINVTDAPVIATHSGVNSLRDHQRNLTDEQLIALAENGGVIGIVFYPAFIVDEYPAYITDIADHIDYAVDLIGIDHVGLGSDFDGASLPDDMKDSSELYKLTDELIRRGYSDDDIKKLLGENMLRVLKEVEEAAEYDPKNVDTGITITPSYDMGQIIQTNMPHLSAHIETEEALNIDDLQFRIIVDGIAYEPDIDLDSATMSLSITEPLKERFHVVTFEASNDDGKVQRETTIFYVDGNTDNLKRHVQYFADNGEFESDHVSQALALHLTAVGHYEKTGAMDKVVKHLEGFHVLLDQQKENDLISEKAYQVLKNDADFLINYWQ